MRCSPRTTLLQHTAVTAGRRTSARCRAAQVSEFWSLGLAPIAVSAISGTGTGDLMEQLVATLPPPKRRGSDGGGEAPPKPLAVAIVGRPNVGKSSLLNSLVRPPLPAMSAGRATLLLPPPAL